MSAPLFALDGMLSGSETLALGEVLDRIVVDSERRLLVSLIDVLAVARLDRNSDVLLVEFVDGSSRALRVADVLERNDVFIMLIIDDREASGEVRCSVWSEHVRVTPVVASIRAMTFAAFVGSS